MATLEDCRADLRQHLDEVTPVFWDNTVLDRWIYEALRDVARRTETLQAVATYPTTNGRLQYDAPADMLRIYRVEYRSAGQSIYPLEYQPLNNMDDVWWVNRGSTGTPMWWSFWGFPSDQDRAQIYIYPAPSEDLDAGIAVFYYRLPHKPQQDNDTVDIPAGWEDLIPLYAEVVARRKDNDRLWQEAQAIYEERLGQMMQTTRLPSDQATYFSGENSGIPAWARGGTWDW